LVLKLSRLLLAPFYSDTFYADAQPTAGSAGYNPDNIKSTAYPVNRTTATLVAGYGVRLAPTRKFSATTLATSFDHLVSGRKFRTTVNGCL
jgi:hypothetical protein